MVENVGQSFWIGKRTVPQSQGGPQILKGGPNFEQKGDQKGTQKFSELFTKSEYVKIVEKLNSNIFRDGQFSHAEPHLGLKDT